MVYPLRFPLSGMVGALGLPLSIRIDVGFDKEAQVFVASSPDVPGLVAEAKTMDELRAEAFSLIPELLELNSGIRIVKGNEIRLKEELHLCPA